MKVDLIDVFKALSVKKWGRLTYIPVTFKIWVWGADGTEPFTIKCNYDLHEFCREMDKIDDGWHEWEVFEWRADVDDCGEATIWIEVDLGGEEDE